MLLISGLDLGQVQDYSAFTTVERIAEDYHVRYLQRFKLGTSYLEIVARMTELYSKAPLADSWLAVDQTGVGRPVVEMLRAQCHGAALQPVTITAGHAVSEHEDGSLHVPKKDLVGSLQVLLQSGRLKIARSLPDAAALTKELTTFKVKITKAANEVFEGWRTGDKDDLVLAVALAVWVAEHRLVDLDFGGSSAIDARDTVARAPKGIWHQQEEYPEDEY